jgi:hypothetical protein
MKKVTLVLKIAIYSFLILFCAAILFRIFTASYYPKDIKRIHFTEELTEYYRENTDSFKAYTQKIRTKYDDPDKGNFFANHLIVVPDAGHLQVAIRYNESTLENLTAEYGTLTLDEEGAAALYYVLCVSYGEEKGTRTYAMSDESYNDTAFMYHYTKLIFEGVDFKDAIWMRVDIYCADGDGQTPFGSIPVYESQVDVDGTVVPYELKEYKVKNSEFPK